MSECVCVSFWTAKQVQMLLLAVGGTRADHDKNYNTHVRSHWLKADFMGNCLLRSQHTYLQATANPCHGYASQTWEDSFGKGNRILFTSLIQTSKYYFIVSSLFCNEILIGRDIFLLWTRELGGKEKVAPYKRAISTSFYILLRLL